MSSFCVDLTIFCIKKKKFSVWCPFYVQKRARQSISNSQRRWKKTNVITCLPSPAFSSNLYFLLYTILYLRWRLCENKRKKCTEKRKQFAYTSIYVYNIRARRATHSQIFRIRLTLTPVSLSTFLEFISSTLQLVARQTMKFPLAFFFHFSHSPKLFWRSTNCRFFTHSERMHIFFSFRSLEFM